MRRQRSEERIDDAVAPVLIGGRDQADRGGQASLVWQAWRPVLSDGRSRQAVLRIFLDWSLRPVAVIDAVGGVGIGIRNENKIKQREYKWHACVGLIQKGMGLKREGER